MENGFIFNSFLCPKLEHQNGFMLNILALAKNRFVLVRRKWKEWDLRGMDSVYKLGCAKKTKGERLNTSLLLIKFEFSRALQ